MNKRFIKSIIRRVIIIIALVELLITCTQVFVTTCKLWNISQEIKVYNSLSIKTDKDTEIAQRYFDQREELYHSSDLTVSTFTKMPGIIKLLVVILVIIVIPYSISIICLQVKMIIKIINKRNNRS